MNIASTSRNLPLPTSGMANGRLVIHGGTTDLTLRVDRSLPALFRGSFEGVLPRVEENGGTVDVRYSRLGFLAWLFSGREETRAQIVLKGGIPWEIEIHGGLVTVDADLSGLRLERLEVHGGIRRGMIRLPDPAGTVPLRITGGASRVRILRPEGTPLSCRAEGGMAGTTFDGLRPGGLASGSIMETEDYATAADRYNLEITGGAHRLRFETLASEQIERRVVSLR